MSELTFDRDMGVVAARAVYPETPSLRARVAASIDVPLARPPARTRPRLAFAVVGAGLLAVALAATLAVPTSRSAVADFFGIEGSEIDVIPANTPLPPPLDVGAFAERTTLDAASDAVGFDLAMPQDGAPPPTVYIVRYGAQPVVVMRYDDFDLWQARLPSDANFGKGAPPGVTIEDTFVDGMPARWVAGGPHVVMFTNERGEFVDGSVRTVEGNTLIWNDGTTFYRLETHLEFEQALEVAESLP